MELKMTSLIDFGFVEPVAEHIPKCVINDGVQLCLVDMPFTCPMSKDVWQSKELHNARCQYKYCKGKWDFRHIY